MSKTILVLDEVSKSYHTKDSLTLRQWITTWGSSRSSTYSALNKLSLEVKQGDCLGIIGANGAGKSTLLKLIARVIYPSSGTIAIHGKVSALLEVGTGFYPDMTGRENIFISGQLLGMTRRDIWLKQRDIVQFSGVGAFIDKPIRSYSSGMKARLGFSVAAFLRQDLILVDEVLAVGDLAFKQQCYELITSGLRDKGKTYLLATHDLEMMQTLCSTALVLEHGKLQFEGDTAVAVKHYLGHGRTSKHITNLQINGFTVYDIMINKEASCEATLYAGKPCTIEFKLKGRLVFTDLLVRLQIRCGNKNIAVLNNALSSDSFLDIDRKEISFSCQIESLPLIDNTYEIDLDCSDSGRPLFHYNSLLKITMQSDGFFASKRTPSKGRGYLLINHKWLYE